MKQIEVRVPDLKKTSIICSVTPSLVILYEATCVVPSNTVPLTMIFNTRMTVAGIKKKKERERNEKKRKKEKKTIVKCTNQNVD